MFMLAPFLYIDAFGNPYDNGSKEERYARIREGFCRDARSFN